MQKKEVQSIGEILHDYLNMAHLESLVFEEKIAKIWQETLGDEITKETGRIQLKNGCLFIILRSPALKTELMMRRTSIARAINQKLGEEIIKSVFIQ